MNAYEQIEAFGYVDDHLVASLDIPDPDHLSDAATGVFAMLDELMTDTLLDADCEPLIHAVATAMHRRAAKLARERGDAETRIRQLINQQDGSEILDVELQSQQALHQRLDQRETALMQLRDAMADAFEARFGRPWTPASGRIRTGVTAAMIDARDYLQARKEREIAAKAPEGTPVAIAGGPAFTDVDAVWTALDRARNRVGDMILFHGGATKGVDRIASLWAKDRGVPQVAFVPDFQKHNKAAPFRRNDAMLACKPRGVIIFPGNGISENLAQKAEAAQITVWRPIAAETPAAQIAAE